MRVDQAELLLIQELYNRSKSQGVDSSLGEWINIAKLTGDASTRKYYRVHTSGDSFVVCLDQPLKEGQKENPFLVIQKHLQNHNIRVPKIFDNDQKKGYILEEDLGDETLLRYLATVEDQKQELDYYKSAVDEIIKLHSITDIDRDVFNLAFDYKKLSDEINFTLKYFINLFLEQDNISKQITDGFDDICLEIAKHKMVITHRDYHSRNIMLKKSELVLIDFQDARMGAPQYDLASLLEDCYYRVSGKNKEALRKYYWDKMDKAIIGYDNFDTFNNVYVHVAIQRVFKAIGSFSYIYHYREDHRYLKYIGYAMENLRLLLLQDKKFDDLRKKLFSIYYGS